MSKIDIVSDEDCILVHGNANFGPDISARMVVDEGVILYAYYYTSNSTQMNILYKHGLIRKPKAGSLVSTLTSKGYKYLRALMPISVIMAAAKAQEQML